MPEQIQQQYQSNNGRSEAEESTNNTENTLESLNSLNNLQYTDTNMPTVLSQTRGSLETRTNTYIDRIKSCFNTLCRNLKAKSKKIVNVLINSDSGQDTVIITGLVMQLTFLFARLQQIFINNLFLSGYINAPTNIYLINVSMINEIVSFVSSGMCVTILIAIKTVKYLVDR